jgi:hypothetical protein
LVSKTTSFGKTFVANEKGFTVKFMPNAVAYKIRARRFRFKDDEGNQRPFEQLQSIFVGYLSAMGVDYMLHIIPTAGKMEEKKWGKVKEQYKLGLERVYSLTSEFVLISAFFYVLSYSANLCFSVC